MTSPWEWFRKVYDYLLSLFWSTELDITLLGLQNAGKTSLLRVLVGEDFTPDSIPTVGFAMKRVKMGLVTLKCWDLGGQPRFRSMWERYCKGVSAIISSIPAAKRELHDLMTKESLQGIPLLILGNKNDLPEALSVDEVIEQLDLKSIEDRLVSCYSISVKEATNLNAVLSWLISRSKE